MLLLSKCIDFQFFEFFAVDHAPNASSADGAAPIATAAILNANPDEILIDDDDVEEGGGGPSAHITAPTANPDEIDIGDIDEYGDGEKSEKHPQHIAAAAAAPPAISNPDEIDIGDD